MSIERNLGYYYELIANLTISELIIYYFIGYIFIVSINRILRIKIDTLGNFRTNPKILLGLILLYIFGKILIYFPSDNLYISAMSAGTILIVTIWVLEKAFYGLKSKKGFGFVPLVLIFFMNRSAKSYLERNKRSSLKGRSAIVDKPNIKDISDRMVSEDSVARGCIDFFLIDLFVLIIIIHYVVSLSLMGLLSILLAPIVLADPWRALVGKYGFIMDDSPSYGIKIRK